MGHIHVTGSVSSERDLVDVVHKGLLNKATRNGGTLGF